MKHLKNPSIIFAILAGVFLFIGIAGLLPVNITYWACVVLGVIFAWIALCILLDS